ncbi:MAG: DUF4142 domain-containing protein [Alphaproteobacteria bacterium]
MKTTHLLAGTALVALLGAASVQAQEKTAHEAMTAPVSVSTKNFVKSASVGNEFEIETSQLALDRSTEEDVRKFAQHMIDDHGTAQQNLEAALPTDIDPLLAQHKLDPKHQHMYDVLKAAKPANFNAAYLHAQHNAHSEAIGLFTTYAKSGDQKDLRQFAQNTLPTIEDHAKQLSTIHATADAK